MDAQTPTTTQPNAAAAERMKHLELENKLLREVVEGLVGQIVQLHAKFRLSLYPEDEME